MVSTQAVNLCSSERLTSYFLLQAEELQQFGPEPGGGCCILLPLLHSLQYTETNRGYEPQQWSCFLAHMQHTQSLEKGHEWRQRLGKSISRNKLITRMKIMLLIEHLNFYLEIFLFPNYLSSCYVAPKRTPEDN